MCESERQKDGGLECLRHCRSYYYARIAAVEYPFSLEFMNLSKIRKLDCTKRLSEDIPWKKKSIYVKNGSRNVLFVKKKEIKI